MKKTASIAFLLLISGVLFAQGETKREVMSYDAYITALNSALPELKSNEISLLSAQNDVKSAQGAGNVSLSAGGSYSSAVQYDTTSSSDDRLATSNYYVGASKKIVSTGTTVETNLNYSKNVYSATTDEYTAHQPSATVKVTQPLLYNFLGKIDRYSETDAKMKVEIEKLQLSESNKSTLTAYRKLYFQWELYRRILIHNKESIQAAKSLSDKMRANMNAGLAEEYSYRETVTSLLNYQNTYQSNLAILNSIEKQLKVYIDSSLYEPNPKDYDAILTAAGESAFQNTEFNTTESAKIIALSVKNYEYSRGVYENRLLPELDVYGSLTGKNSSDTATSSLADKDYEMGFTLTYKFGNDEAEADLEKIRLQLKSLSYEYESTKNSYLKNLAAIQEEVSGTKARLANKESSVNNLALQLAAQRKKYNQGRLSISDVITTENSLSSAKTDRLNLEYTLITDYIDYCDLVK